MADITYIRKELADSAEGLFSFSLYMRDAKGNKTVLEEKVISYLKGLSLYDYVCRIQGPFSNWRCILYTDRHTLTYVNELLNKQINFLEYGTKSPYPFSRLKELFIQHVNKEFGETLDETEETLREAQEMIKAPFKTGEIATMSKGRVKVFLVLLRYITLMIDEYTIQGYDIFERMTIALPNWEGYMYGADGEYMDGAVLRPMRQRAMEDFYTKPVFVRDCDTILRDLAKPLYTPGNNIETITKYKKSAMATFLLTFLVNNELFREFPSAMGISIESSYGENYLKTLNDWEDMFLQKLQENDIRICFAASPSYSKDFHINHTILNSTPLGMFAGLVSTTGFPEKPDVWRKCKDYVERNYSFKYNANTGTITSSQTTGFRVGIDEKLLIYILCPYFLERYGDKVYFYKLGYQPNDDERGPDGRFYSYEDPATIEYIFNNPEKYDNVLRATFLKQIGSFKRNYWKGGRTRRGRGKSRRRSSRKSNKRTRQGRR